MPAKKNPLLNAVLCGAWIAEGIKLFQGVDSDFSFVIGAMIAYFAIKAWQEF
jgi:hypothetical protein